MNGYQRRAARPGRSRAAWTPHATVSGRSGKPNRAERVLAIAMSPVCAFLSPCGRTPRDHDSWTEISGARTELAPCRFHRTGRPSPFAFLHEFVTNRAVAAL